MAIADEKLISILVSEDVELRKYVMRHRQLDEKIRKYDKQRFLTPREEFERKQLQKMKLAGKDKIEKILCLYRNNQRVIY